MRSPSLLAPATALRLAGLLGALILIALPGTAADEPAPQEPEAVPAPAASPEPAPAPAPVPAADRLGIHAGTHRVFVFGGASSGDTVRDVDIITSPLDEEPYHARIDLGNSTVFGLSYTYFPRDRWGIEISMSRAASELVNPDASDEATMALLLSQTLLTAMEQRDLLDRLVARTGPVDMDVTYVDAGFTWVANPGKRWIVEIGGGIGWASGSLSGGTAFFEDLVVSRQEDPGDIRQVANELIDPTNGADCPADNDPCVKLEGQSGLTWHAIGGASYAFNPHVHLRLGLRFRFVEQVVDPGDSFLNFDGTLGIAFLFGSH